MGTYQLIRRLQQTGVLETSGARQQPGDRPVFVKRLLGPRSNGLGERLVEVARTVRALPGVPLVEACSTGDTFYLVQDGAEGESLRWVMSTLARASGFIAPNEGMAVVAKAAAALLELHRSGVAHGDVCPSTIFLTARGEVQLHDGGVATAIGSLGEHGPARSEPGSIAPEQLTGRPSVASDVFRLGQVLFELAIGRPLFTAATPALHCQTASAWSGLARDKVKQVPEPWLTLLEGMLRADPAQRLGMEEVSLVLERALAQAKWNAEADAARLITRATTGRALTYGGAPGGEELVLQALSPQAPPSPSAPPGAVVARIATKKMTRDELAAVKLDAANEPQPDAPTAPDERAAQLMIERGQLTKEQLQDARDTALITGDSLLAALTASGLDEDLLVSTVGELTRTPSVSAKKLADATPSPEALALISLDLSMETRAVPLGLKGGTQLLVAMIEPMDTRAIERLKAALGNRSMVAFRAGERALADYRARLYPGATNAWAGGMELERGSSSLYDPVSMLSEAPSTQPALVRSEVPSKVIELLLQQLGAKGGQAKQLVSVAAGVAQKLDLTAEQIAQVRHVAEALVTCALAQNRLPHDVPSLMDVQELIGFGTEVDAFAEALHGFPARLPTDPAQRVVVTCFAFAAHTGEARPTGSRVLGALSTFGKRTQLPAPLLEALSAELASSS